MTSTVAGFLPQLPHCWGTLNAGIKVSSAESPRLAKVLSVKPGVGQNKTFHASPTARNGGGGFFLHTRFLEEDF